MTIIHATIVTEYVVDYDIACLYIGIVLYTTVKSCYCTAVGGLYRLVADFLVQGIHKVIDALSALLCLAFWCCRSTCIECIIHSNTIT